MIIQTDKPLRPRAEFDHYPTDESTVLSCLDELSGYMPDPKYILDAGAGSGVWGRVAREIWPCSGIIGVEVRPSTVIPGYDGWINADFLDENAIRPFGKPGSLVMGNPPYCQAEEFVRRGLGLSQPGGRVAFLLRLGFLEGQARGNGLFREHPPAYVWICSRRPSFTGDGKTDATAYAFFVWEKGWHGSPTIDWLRTS